MYSILTKAYKNKNGDQPVLEVENGIPDLTTAITKAWELVNIYWKRMARHKISIINNANGEMIQISRPLSGGDFVDSGQYIPSIYKKMRR